MNCAYPHCQGLVANLRCTDHGAICSNCGIPTIHYREDQQCPTCGARTDGEKCGGCGSPWVYILYSEDGSWRCRACTLNIIHENGWDLTAEEAIQLLKESEEMRSEKKKEREQSDEELRAIQQTMKKRRKPKQTEALFEEGA